MRKLALAFPFFAAALVPMCLACVEAGPPEPPPPVGETSLQKGEYRLTVQGGRIKRFELDYGGAIEGYSDPTLLHCRSTITPDEWTALTDALNAANVMYQPDHPTDCPSTLEPWQFQICTETDRATHCFEYWDCPRIEEVQAVVVMAGNLMWRVWQAGECGPDRYPAP